MRFPIGGLAQLLETDPRYRNIYKRTESINRAPGEWRFRLTPEATRQLADCLPQQEGLTERQREYLRGI